MEGLIYLGLVLLVTLLIVLVTEVIYFFMDKGVPLMKNPPKPPAKK